jgi:hypothetical protein
MKLLQQGRPAILHGAKVGIGTVLIAARYEQLLALSRAEMENRLPQVGLPGWEQDQAEIQRAYGVIAPRIVEEQQLIGRWSQPTARSRITTALGGDPTDRSKRTTRAAHHRAARTGKRAQ